MPMLAVITLWCLVFTTLGRFPELFAVLAPFQLGKVTVALGLIVLLAVRPGNLVTFLKKTPMGQGLLVLLALSFLSIPFSVFKSGALESFIAMCRILLVVSIIMGLCLDGRTQSLRKACIYALLVMGVLMVLDRGTGRVRISSTYDPNDLALLFVVYLPIAAAEILAGDKWTRIAALAASVCAVAGIALTGSRGGIIALAAIGLQAMFLIKKRRWLLFPALALAAVLVGITADDFLWERFQALHDNTDYNLDAKTGRITIWKEGIRLMLTHPLLGVGIGQFPTALGMLGNGAWKAAHNSFIQIGAELGLIGLASFCAIIVFVFRLSKKGATAPFLPPEEQQRFAALRIAITGYCVGGFFLSQAYGFIYFVFLALAGAMYMQLREAEQAANVREKPDAVPSAAIDGDFAPHNAPRRSSGSRSAAAASKRRRREERLRQGDLLYACSRKKGGGV